jgi:glycosyltransferase involved in cell wall biosynthesis
MHVQILGTRGIPSCHGGFETFAQDLALYLCTEGHEVTVYCHASSSLTRREEMWQGVRLVHIPASESPLGTMSFDFQSALHACKEKGIALTLGYNTALFSLLYRLSGHKNIMNMDGIEWRREKWSLPAKTWLILNEWLGAKLSDHLIADHPMIAEHLYRHTKASKISVIPYGSVAPAEMDAGLLDQFNLQPKAYYLVIARAEPENSILEIVEGFSASERETELVVLGRYLPEKVPYHNKVLKAAGDRVRFIGPVYDRLVVAALRFNAKGYVHGHRVGGTNPSLVEAMAAGNAIIAHDNVFTRWVAGAAGMYFKSAREIAAIFDKTEANSALLSTSSSAALLQHQHNFSQSLVLTRYEDLLQRFSLAPSPHESLGATTE